MRRRPGTSRSCDAAPWCSPASCACAQPDYGYALLESLNALGIIVDANTLYPLLRRLEKQGLLASEWNTEEARPRKFYRTSPAGEALADVLTTDWRRIDDALARTHDRRRPMTTLTDRYVWAAARTLPDAQRAEFDRELRERIGDATDALVETGRAPADAERMALVELGDPAALAASYVDRPLQLIGPRYYLTWWRLLKLLLLGRAADRRRGASSSRSCCRAPTWARSSGTRSAWASPSPCTSGSGPRSCSPCSSARRASGADLAWTPDMLPQLPELSRPGRRGELIGSLVFLGIFALVIVWQQFGLPWVDALETIPLLDPDLWTLLDPVLPRAHRARDAVRDRDLRLGLELVARRREPRAERRVRRAGALAVPHRAAHQPRGARGHGLAVGRRGRRDRAASSSWS